MAELRQTAAKESARFLCRSRREIREKITELQQSGELVDLIEKEHQRQQRLTDQRV